MSTCQQPQNRAAEVLQIIAEALTRQPSNDASEHFPSLRARTRRLHRDFLRALDIVDALTVDWCRTLEKDMAVKDEFKRLDGDKEPFRRVLPIIVTNFQRVAHSLVAATEPAPPATTFDEIKVIDVEFEDFIGLGSVVRQYTDSLVETSYQLGNLDAATFNYKFLESLISFAPVAPHSLHQTLYSADLQKIVKEFADMTGGQRKDSTFSRNEHSQFGQRVAWLVGRVDATNEVEKSLNHIFKFCSDFVHLGYASSVALGHAGTPQIVIGTGDYYTAPILNYAELRVRLLAECARYYAEIFLSMLGATFKATLVDADDLMSRTKDVAHNLDEIRHYVAGTHSIEFIRDGLIESDLVIEIECGFCSTILLWQAPHHVWDCYCEGCGKQFQADIVPEAVDYVISCEGSSKVNGSDAPEIADLPAHLREKLQAIRRRHVPVRQGTSLPYVQITDLERVDPETLSVPGIITSRPDARYDGQFPVIAFVASKALERRYKIEINCNCGAKAVYEPGTGSNICRCSTCQTAIGIFGISGDASELPVMDTANGPQRFVPIHEARSIQLKNQQSEK